MKYTIIFILILYTFISCNTKEKLSNNDLIKEKLGWSPSVNLKDGIEKTYLWIKDQID